MRSKKILELRFAGLVVAISVVLSLVTSARASDPVLDWVQIMNDTIINTVNTATPTSPLVTTRQTALVAAAVFDAVNGIEPRYQPLLVAPDATRPASARAAAIEAAYAVLASLYPAQQGTLAGYRQASLMHLSGESAKAIANGINWGDTVANTVLLSRATDGFNPPAPPFEGVLAITQPTGVNLGINVNPGAVIGMWRPTPTGAAGGKASGAGPQFASMTPWVLTRPSQFRLPPPYASDMSVTSTIANALTSPEYMKDYNELKSKGVLNGSSRSDDETQLALFWAGNTALFWNRIARDLSMSHKPRPLTLTQNAHLFALLNIAMADAGIACWDGKYRYVFWRPITAIRSGGPNIDGAPDTSWQPLLDSHPIAPFRGTPAHPEYPSGHSTVSGAAAFILAAAFGEDSSFTLTSDAMPPQAGQPPVTRSFHSFKQATDEIADARVFGGIHYRTSCVRGNTLGQAVAGYVSTHAMLRRDEDEDNDRE